MSDDITTDDAVDEIPRPVINAGLWVLDAACGDTDPNLFIWEGAAKVSDVMRAASICASCKVRDECAADAEAGDEIGIWGGVLRTRGRVINLVEHIGDSRWWEAWRRTITRHPGRLGIRLFNNERVVVDEVAS